MDPKPTTCHLPQCVCVSKFRISCSLAFLAGEFEIAGWRVSRFGMPETRLSGVSVNNL